MGKKNKPKKNGDKKPATESISVRIETTIIIAVIALVVGFFAGEIIDLSKSDRPAVSNIPPGAAQQRPQVPPSSQMPSVASIQDPRIMELEKQVASEPGNVEAWTELGNLYFDGAQIKKAIRAYKKSLDLNPYNANIWTDLGVMYRRNKQPIEALGAFNKAADIDPRHEQSRFNKGIVLMHDLEDSEAAIEAWEALLKVNPAAKTSTGQPISQLVESLKNSQTPVATQNKP